MKLTHLFNNNCTQPNTTSFWPSCSQHPKTLSFRSIHCDEGFKVGIASNTSYTNNNDSKDQQQQPTFSTTTLLVEDLLEDEGGERIERVIRGLKSDRLFFELGETSSIIGKGEKSSNSNENFLNRENNVTLMPMESLDPYLDFKKSMEEMVEAHGVKSWDRLQELLGCYLKVNERSNHGFIIGAFVDLLVSLEFEGLELISCSSSSPITFCSSDISTSFCSTLNLPTDEASRSS